MLLARCASAPSPAPASTVGCESLTSEPKLVRRAEPYLPRELRGVAATATVELLVTTSGAVAAAETIEGDPLLGEAVSAAARQWAFEPILVDGRPTAARLRIHTQLTWPGARSAHVSIGKPCAVPAPAAADP